MRRWVLGASLLLLTVSALLVVACEDRDFDAEERARRALQGLENDGGDGGDASVCLYPNHLCGSSSCCTEDEVCAPGEGDSTCQPACNEGETTCSRFGGSFACCKANEVCAGFDGCLPSCGAGWERCGTDCCDPATEYCDGWNRCAPTACAWPTVACGKTCCDFSLERCVVNGKASVCAAACGKEQFPCGTKCCANGDFCEIDRNGNAGCWPSSLDCNADEIRCGDRQGDGSWLCCNAGDRCIVNGGVGTCAPTCAVGATTCGASCCAPQTACIVDKAGTGSCCNFGETSCTDPAGTMACCAVGMRCSVQGCVESCLTSIGETPCGEACCTPNEQCAVVPQPNGQPDDKRCVPRCDDPSLSCGVEGLCCEWDERCGSDGEGNTNCYPECSQPGQFACGNECCDWLQMCDTRTVPATCRYGPWLF